MPIYRARTKINGKMLGSLTNGWAVCLFKKCKAPVTITFYLYSKILQVLDSLNNCFLFVLKDSPSTRLHEQSPSICIERFSIYEAPQTIALYLYPKILQIQSSKNNPLLLPYKDSPSTRPHKQSPSRRLLSVSKDFPTMSGCTCSWIIVVRHEKSSRTNRDNTNVPNVVSRWRKAKAAQENIIAKALMQKLPLQCRPKQLSGHTLRYYGDYSIYYRD